MAKIKDLPKHEQPREKLIEKGPMNLRDVELMAILLRTGIEGKNVLKVSEEILRKFPKKKLLALDFEELSKVKGIGEGKACLLLAAFELTKRALEVEDNNLPVIGSAKDAVSQLQELRTAKKEHFVVLHLNARNQLIHKETISIGILNASLVHPREVFYPAIEQTIDKGIKKGIIWHTQGSGKTALAFYNVNYLTDYFQKKKIIPKFKEIDTVLI